MRARQPAPGHANGRARMRPRRFHGASPLQAPTASMGKHASVLVWSSNLWNFGDGLLGPLFTVFAQRIGGNILDVTWAWGVYLVTMGIGIIIVGHISNRVSKLHLLVTGYLLSTICTFGYLLVHSAEMLFIVQGGLGIATALANPTYLALFARYSAGAGEGSAWGWADGRDKIAIGLAVFAGGFIVNRAGFEVLFIAMGIMQFAATLYLARLLFADDR